MFLQPFEVVSNYIAMKNFKPKLIPTLITIPAMILLLSLGSWQVVRLQWKNNLIDNIKHQMSLPEIDLSNTEPKDNDSFRKAKADGTFDHSKEIHLYAGAREFKGKDGYRIFTPLKLQNGKFILVDRGWVPAGKKLQNTRPETIIQGVVSVSGVIMEGEKKKFFTPENDIKNKMWFWIDIKAMKQESGLSYPDFYLMQEESKDKSRHLPIGRSASPNIYNNHLSYAIIWYSCALSLAVIYFLSSKRD